MKDLGLAFSFPFKDPNWVSKFVIAALFMLLSILLIGVFFLLGYYIQIIQRVSRKEESALPEWDGLGEKFVLGFKYFIVHLIYSLPIVLIYLLFFAAVFAAAFSGEDAEPLVNIISILLVFITLPYSLALSAVTPVIAYRFAASESISDALDVSEMFRLFRLNWQHALIVALIAVGIQSFAAVGLVVFLVGIFFTLWYAYVASAHMAGQLYLDTMGKINAAESNT